MASKKFIQALDLLESEKGIKKEIVLDALKEALEKSYKKNYGGPESIIRVEINEITGKIRLYEIKHVVDDVNDEDYELSLEEAQMINPKYQVGDDVVTEVDPEVLLSDYSMVFQDVVLFDDSIKENIRLGKRNATDEEVYKAAKAANCDEFVQKLPDGYDTLIGENGTKLSGGERQRISIARALLKDAPIILLDEATASLDVENETKIQEALSRLLVNKTVLVIAHRMRTVQSADKIIVLEDGKVKEEGSPEQLYKQNGLYRHMLDLQNESAKWQID